MSAPTFTPGRRRSFSHHNRAWHANASRTPGELDSIGIAMGEVVDGEPDYEFQIAWLDVECPAPRLEMFGESWLAFAECADLFAWLASIGGSPTPWDVCDGLVALGFEDTTQTERRLPWQATLPHVTRATMARYSEIARVAYDANGGAEGDAYRAAQAVNAALVAGGADPNDAWEIQTQLEMIPADALESS